MSLWSVRARLGRSAIFLKIVAALVALWLVVPILVVLPISFNGEASFDFPPESWSTRW
jgi:putative spermidine/putrescine transport system permease protein